jgi:hypothetical protein
MAAVGVDVMSHTLLAMSLMLLAMSLTLTIVNHALLSLTLLAKSPMLLAVSLILAIVSPTLVIVSPMLLIVSTILATVSPILAANPILATVSPTLAASMTTTETGAEIEAEMARETADSTPRTIADPALQDAKRPAITVQIIPKQARDAEMRGAHAAETRTHNVLTTLRSLFGKAANARGSEPGRKVGGTTCGYRRSPRSMATS